MKEIKWKIHKDGFDEIYNCVDEFGNPVSRTKQTHPYSYDGFVLWRGGENNEATATVYSDRLLQWDYEKHNKLCMKYFGDEAQLWWDKRSPQQIEKFLRDWFDNENLKLVLIMEYCNISNGYPCWRFDFAV